MPPIRSNVLRAAGRAILRVAWPLLFACALPALGVDPLAGQVDPARVAAGDVLYQVLLTDGSMLVARVTAVDGDRVTLTTSGGTSVVVDRSQIREIRPSTGRLVDGEIWPEDPNGSRLFFASTGRNLPAGRVYAGTYLIVLPYVGIGVTDRFTIAAGAPVLLGELQPFYLAPKLQIIRSDRVNLAVGALHFLVDQDGFLDGDDVGLGYVVATFGGEDGAVSVGLGAGYEGTDFESQALGMFGFERRAGRNVKLISENYLLPDDNGLVVSGGIRILGERLAADLGVAGALGDGGGGCCVPIVGVSYLFGGPR